MANSRNYRVPTDDDDPNVPVWMDRLASDVAGDMDGVEAMAAAPGRPEVVQDIPMAVVTDAVGRHTWLGARAEDGGPTDLALRHLRDRIPGLPDLSSTEGVLAVFLDALGRHTWLGARAEDGGPTDLALRHLRTRLGVGGSTSLAGEVHVRGDEVLPVMPANVLTGWGSSSMADPQLYTFLSDELPTLPMANAAAGAQWGRQMLARANAAPALVTVDGGTIPAERIQTPVTSPECSPVPYWQGITGTLAGVHGELGRSGALGSDTATLFFTRTSAGSAVPVPPGTPFIADLGVDHRSDKMLIWSKNTLTGDPDGVALTLADYAAMFSHNGSLVSHALALGPFATQWQAENAPDLFTSVWEQLAARYGSRYVDVPGFLASPEVWTLSGVTPTAEDQAAQAAPVPYCPPSLTTDGSHLNQDGNLALAKFLAPIIRSLGWIEE